MDGYAAKSATVPRFDSTSRSVMAKKFKLDAGANTFVEMNTLLEPANNATAQQHDKEEIAEVSQQLSQIKKKHDEAKKLATNKQLQYQELLKEIEALDAQESQLEGPMYQNKTRLQQLRDQHAATMNKIDEERMTQRTYRHMLDRMKKDFIASKLKVAELDKSLHSKKGVFEVEEQKQRKTKEVHLQSKNTFDNLMKNIEKEQKDRQDRILELQKCIANKEESVKRRIERQKKNQEIAENAANESKDSTELKMRNYLYINKLWNTFMKRKMAKEMSDSQAIDDAFKQIKTATQVTDVQTMVQRFRQREQTYTALLQTVSSSDAKVDKLKKENEELNQRLHELKIDQGDHDNKGSESADTNDTEIIQMNQDLAQVNQKLQQLQQRFKRINIVNDQIQTWAKRVHSKFGVLTDDPVFREDPSDMVRIFEVMNMVTSKELDMLRQKQAQEDAEDDGIEYGDVFNNFATEDFVNKNIRVRPKSGITADDGRQSNISRGMGESGTEDRGDIDGQLAKSDIEAVRSLVKTRMTVQKDAERKRKAQEEKEKKNR